MTFCDFGRATRGLDLMMLGQCEWVSAGHNVLITGPTGRWQVLAGLCISAGRLSAGPLGDLPACTALAGRTAHPARPESAVTMTGIRTCYGPLRTTAVV